MWPEPRAQLLYYHDRMRALGVASVLGSPLAGSAVPEHSDPAFEVARILWRVHLGLGSESRAKFHEIHWPSGTFQTPENISCDPVLEIDEPDGAVPR